LRKKADSSKKDDQETLKEALIANATLRTEMRKSKSERDAEDDKEAIEELATAISSNKQCQEIFKDRSKQPKKESTDKDEPAAVKFHDWPQYGDVNALNIDEPRSSRRDNRPVRKPLVPERKFGDDSDRRGNPSSSSSGRAMPRDRDGDHSTEKEDLYTWEEPRQRRKPPPSFNLFTGQRDKPVSRPLKPEEETKIKQLCLETDTKFFEDRIENVETGQIIWNSEYGLKYTMSTYIQNADMMRTSTVTSPAAVHGQRHTVHGVTVRDASSSPRDGLQYERRREERERADSSRTVKTEKKDWTAVLGDDRIDRARKISRDKDKPEKSDDRSTSRGSNKRDDHGSYVTWESSNLEVLGLGRIELQVDGKSAKNAGVAIRRSKIRRTGNDAKIENETLRLPLLW